MPDMPNRRGHNLTPALCRKGGLAAAAKLTTAQRRAGGRQRAAQPSFVEHQRTRGRKGAQVTLQRHGPKTLLTKLAAWRRVHPTDLDRWVMEVLDSHAIPYQYQVLRDLGPDRVCVLDFLVLGRGPGGADLIIEPGHRLWHGNAAETLDGQDHQAQDAARTAALAHLGYHYILALTDHDIHQEPDATRRRLLEFLTGALPPQE